MLNEEYGSQNELPSTTSAFRIPHSVFRIHFHSNP